MADIATSLSEFGADPASLHVFEKDSPDLLPYATLVTARKRVDSTLAAVGAVYEWQGAPLIFIVDADLIKSKDQLLRIRRLLAMRGDAPYLGVVKPGQLEVYRIALDKKNLPKARVKIDDSKGSKYAAIAQLGSSRPQAAISQRGWIYNVILKLLTESIDKLTALQSVSKEDAISLAGRALFTRFLADRDLLPADMLQAGSAAQLFDNSENAQKTSSWLDKTFNGDLLPLSDETFDTLPKQAYGVLGSILRKAQGDGQLSLGWEEKWNNLDFAHIPVGVLSQAYENYLREHEPGSQRRKGGYYTPRPIADLMVRASFGALEREGKSSTAKVLDPAAGAGVFLLTAFRELVAARWKADGERPNTKTLRSILYGQIVGFDIDEAALRFTALGLYLMSIELDPKPKPVNKLSFKKMRGTVLHRFGPENADAKPGLGSLGPLVGKEHRGKYDLVIGNPPWASRTNLADWELVEKTISRIATERGIVNQSPPLPNKVLDLPFVWRAMEWAKPNGQITYALHARLLFQQGRGDGKGMLDARLALFEALEVTSIINGADLRTTQVWPKISAPFCLLFATNSTPGPGAGFRLISPRLEKSLNDAGVMRIDVNDAEIIPTRQLAETPEVLKVLFRGTKADLSIVERIRAQEHPTLEGFWCKAIGGEVGSNMRGSGRGYETLKKSSPIRKKDGDQKGYDAENLHGLPKIDSNSFSSIYINTQALKPFSYKRLHRSKEREFFTGPLLLAHQTIPAAEGRIDVAITEKDAAYSESFYGYSPLGCEAAGELVRYLALLLGSKLALWIVLVTSGKFGSEREAFEKITLDCIPIPDFRKFTSEQRQEITSKFEALHTKELAWEDIDQWVAKLYGLGPRDLEVISDTLELNLPFAESKNKAQSVPTRQDIERFCQVLKQELDPWAERFGSSLAIDSIFENPASPWYGIGIWTREKRRPNAIPACDWHGLLNAADHEAASEIMIPNEEGELLIGRLAQRRYWSNTQARLLAQRIIWSHLDLLKGHANA